MDKRQQKNDELIEQSERIKLLIKNKEQGGGLQGTFQVPRNICQQGLEDLKKKRKEILYDIELLGANFYKE